MYRHAGVVRDRLELVESDVEPVADREGARSDEGVTAAHLAALDPRKRERHALAGRRPLHLAVVDLDAADPHLTTVGLESEHVAGADRAGPERPGDDRPDAAQ